MSDVNRQATREPFWLHVRGEAVEMVGLLGDVLEEWGQRLQGWTRRKRF